MRAELNILVAASRRYADTAQEDGLDAMLAADAELRAALAQAEAALAAAPPANDPDEAPDDPIFQGRGQALAFYSKGEDVWPPAWQLPEQDDDEADLFGKFAWLADDLVLRTAVNIWDNGLRLPGSFEGIVGGIISAHARLVVGSGGCADLTKAADAVRAAWLGMAEQAAKLGAADAGTA